MIPDDTDCVDTSIGSSDIDLKDATGCDDSGTVKWRDDSDTLSHGDSAEVKMIVELTSGANDGDKITNDSACATSTDDSQGDCDEEKTTVTGEASTATPVATATTVAVVAATATPPRVVGAAVRGARAHGGYRAAGDPEHRQRARLQQQQRASACSGPGGWSASPARRDRRLAAPPQLTINEAYIACRGGTGSRPSLRLGRGAGLE